MGADLSFVELGTAFELDFLVSEAWNLNQLLDLGQTVSSPDSMVFLRALGVRGFF